MADNIRMQTTAHRVVQREIIIDIRIHRKYKFYVRNAVVKDHANQESPIFKTLYYRMSTSTSRVNNPSYCTYYYVQAPVNYPKARQMRWHILDSYYSSKSI